MKTKNFTTTITVSQSPKAVFDAINNVRGWWSGEILGRTDKLGEEFTYRYEDLHRTTQKITEFIPGKKVVWHVLKSRISFVKDMAEWNGTEIVFEITKKSKKTQLQGYCWSRPESASPPCAHSWKICRPAQRRSSLCGPPARRISCFAQKSASWSKAAVAGCMSWSAAGSGQRSTSSRCSISFPTWPAATCSCAAPRDSSRTSSTPPGTSVFPMIPSTMRHLRYDAAGFRKLSSPRGTLSLGHGRKST